MDKRIFIAIPLESELQKKAAEWKEEFTRRTGIKSVRWIDPKWLHITLVPPWQAKEKEIEMIKHILTQAIRPVMPFQLELHSVSYGPDQSHPNLIWAEGAVPPDVLVLKDRIEKTLLAARMPIVVEKNPQKVHVTLARFLPEAFSLLKDQQLHEKIHWYGMISSIVVFQSVLQMEGAEYSLVEKFDLH